jgi:translation initiation factor IF-3
MAFNRDSQKNQNNGVRFNFQIRAPQVRVILSDGTNAGVMKTSDAIKLATQTGEDLIEINPKSDPPVCRIEELGKWKFAEKKKVAEAKRNTFVSELKEIGLRVATAAFDLQTKTRAAQGFLDEGHRVKFVVKFRGQRELQHLPMGLTKLEEVIKMLGEGIDIVSPAKIDGRTTTMTIAAAKKKGETK